MTQAIGSGRAESGKAASSLSFEGIRHAYHGKTTLHDVSLTAEPGEGNGVGGQSGQGRILSIST